MTHDLATPLSVYSNAGVGGNLTPYHFGLKTLNHSNVSQSYVTGNALHLANWAPGTHYCSTGGAIMSPGNFLPNTTIKEKHKTL